MTTPTVKTIADGVMTITLDGQDIDLFATPAAAKAVSRVFGGLTDAFSKVNRYDFQAMVSVMNAATGRTGKAASETETEIFGAGIASLAPLLIQYLQFLAAGGKALEEAKPEPTDGAGAEVGNGTGNAA